MSRLGRNITLNLIGQSVPFAAAVVAIPSLIAGLGTDRFGVLTLAWLIIGYSSFFDFGLGRAMTQAVARDAGRGSGAIAPPLVWTALAAMFLLGIAGAIIVTAVSPWLVQSVLRIPDALKAESLSAFRTLAWAIPVVVVSTGLVGVLAAFHRFGAVNAIRAPTTVYGFVAPLAVLPYSRSLAVVAAVLVAGRGLSCVAYLVACRPVMPALRSSLSVGLTEIKPLLHFGAWMTVTSTISPLMVYLDRLVIGSMLSVAAVAYYATPYEMVTKVLVVPDAVLGVLFPAFAASHRQDRARMAQLFVRGTKFIGLILFPVLLVLIAFAPEIVRWWLGDAFASISAPVLRCLAIGVFANGIAQLFATLLHGTGRPDLTAKLHLLELPIYLPALWWLVRDYGVLGAAMAWTGRVMLDAVLLFWLSTRAVGGRSGVRAALAAGLLGAIALLTLPLALPGLDARVVMVSVTAVGFLPVAWRYVLASDERAYLKELLGGHAA